MPDFNHDIFIVRRNKSTEYEIQKIKGIFAIKYSNWMDLDGNKSTWYLKNEVENIASGVLAKKRTYLFQKANGT